MARRILLCVRNTAVYFVSVWNWLRFWQVKDGGKMIILSPIFSQLWLDKTGPIRDSEGIYFLFWIHNNILDIISKYLIDRSYISWDITSSRERVEVRTVIGPEAPVFIWQYLSNGAVDLLSARQICPNHLQALSFMFWGRELARSWAWFSDAPSFWSTSTERMRILSCFGP